MLFNVIIPDKIDAADEFVDIGKPDVDDTPEVALALLYKKPFATYPDVVYVVDPVPSWIRKLSVLFKLTSLNITVTRFTHDGIPVKSMLVPDVEATAVPEVIPSTAPLLIVTLAEPSITVAMISPRTKC